MEFTLSKFELRIISYLDNSCTIGELTERIGVTKGYVSRTIASLKNKGFVEITSKGNTKKVILSNNLHAVKLRTILHNRSYMPLTELLHGSGITILAVLSSGKANFSRLLGESGLSEATLGRWIRKFKEHAMLLHWDHIYELPQDFQDIKEFLQSYCVYIAVSTLKETLPEGFFITSHGFEFLFASDKQIVHKNVKPSGLTVISDSIPLMLVEDYYFYSSRSVSMEEIAVHTIVADPYSKRNLTYVTLYILKAKLDKNLFLNISTQYNVVDICRSLLDLLDTWKQSEYKFIPAPSYIKEKAKEYNIPWQE